MLTSSPSAPDDDPALRRRPLGSGDEWVDLPDGRRFWGRYGAAGLLVGSGAGRILLQHRAGYSHFGGTWGLPGGARHEGESALAAALRESAEEAGVPDDLVVPSFTSVLDLGVWSYTTVVARTEDEFPAVIGDAESIELRWVPEDEVADLPLHPGFGAAWPDLRPLLAIRPVLLVDGANVVGSRPDGWWKDRAGAAERLAIRLDALARSGIGAGELDLPGHTWWPEVQLVLEGQALGAEPGTARVGIVRAERDGDSALVEFVRRLGRSRPATVVTADRALGDDLRAAGARVIAPGRLLAALDAQDDAES